MQAEKATSDREVADPAASDEALGDGLPLHAAASMTMAAAARRTTALRAAFVFIVCSDQVLRGLGSSGLTARP